VEGEGLAAVCSYGMPTFYNKYIDRLQTRALDRWLQVRPGAEVLDIGCGIGRWSRRLARAGALVTGVDHSPTMIVEARKRAASDGVLQRCRFLVADIAEAEFDKRFNLILGVTVLQHLMQDDRLAAALRNLARHLAPSGRIVLLEAAPSFVNRRCDTAIFCAREEWRYVEAFRASHLRCVDVRAVDPAPFKTWWLPWHRKVPKSIGYCGLLMSTLAAVPLDAMAAHMPSRSSWHKVFILEHEAD